MHRSLIIATLALSVSTVSFAQTNQSKISPAAIRLAKTHKVFLGVSWAPSNETTQALYEAMTSALTKNNGYELVTNPADAELILDLSVSESTFWNLGKLKVIDPATHATVWNFVESIGSGLHATVTSGWSGNEKKIADKLSDDLKKIAAL